MRGGDERRGECEVEEAVRNEHHQPVLPLIERCRRPLELRGIDFSDSVEAGRFCSLGENPVYSYTYP